MALDRKTFFDGIRNQPFSGSLKAETVQGITAILDEWDRRKLTDLRWLSDMLATVLRECGQNMLPVREVGRGRGKKYGAPAANGNLYYGRGLVQLTWLDNYAKFRAEVLRLFGVDIVADPDAALRPDIAAYIMFEGMIRGSFTGKKLADYFNGTTTDWRNARRIINGVDHAEEIAANAKHFYADLLAAQTDAAPGEIMHGGIDDQGKVLVQPKPAPVPVTPIALPAPPSAPSSEASVRRGQPEQPAPKKRDWLVGAILAAILAAALAAWNWAMEHLPEIFLGTVALAVVALVIFRLTKGHWPWTSSSTGARSPAPLPLSLPSLAGSSATPSLRSEELLDRLQGLRSLPRSAPRRRRKRSAAPSRKTPPRRKKSSGSKRSTRTR